LADLATGLMSFGQAQDNSGRSCAGRVGELGDYFNEDGENDDDEVYKIML